MTQTNPKKGLIEKKTSHISVCFTKFVFIKILKKLKCASLARTAPAAAAAAGPRSAAPLCKRARAPNGSPLSPRATGPTPTASPAAPSSTSWHAAAVTSTCSQRLMAAQLTAARTASRSYRKSTHNWFCKYLNLEFRIVYFKQSWVITLKVIKF